MSLHARPGKKKRTAPAARAEHPFADQLVVVVGYGASGRAAAAALASEGARVRVTESRPEAQVDVSGMPPGVELLADGHHAEHLDDATLVVTSPGVPPSAPILRWARDRKLPIWSELELGARLCTVPYLAVTGTNGKTTTVELLAAMLSASGLKARACGNVGHPFSLAAREPWDVLAVEASSFQLYHVDRFHPRVSVLLNLAPDHLDWHGTMDAYAAAKGRIFERQRRADTHVGNAADVAAAAVSSQARCRIRWFRDGAPELEETGVRDGHVVVRDGGDDRGGGTTFRIPVEAPGIAEDAAAAVTAALAFGIEPGAVQEGIDSFSPLGHRGEVVAETDRVRFLDDSKATNPHATLAALAGRRDVVLIAGGLAKGVDLSPLRSAAEALTAVVAIGQATEELERVFAGATPVRRATTIEEAVALAFVEAAAGGDVILAPACASQDMFRDYRERGERFAGAARALVVALAKTDSGDADA
jgi:UDP-N-acetylmuramoylalanine--D-glutamate ligase